MALKATVGWALVMASTQGVRMRERATDCYSKYDGKFLLQVSPKEHEVADMQAKMELGRCTELNDGGLAEGITEEAICSFKVAEELKSVFGKSVRVLTKNAGAYYRSHSGTTEPFVSVFNASVENDNFYQNWRGYADQTAAVEAAVRNSGGVATLETFGTSREEREMKLVRIRGANYRPGRSPKLLFTFNLHAREWLTGMAGTYAVEKMVAKAKENPNWIAGMEIVLVPMANPDGFVFSEQRQRYWRKNRAPGRGFFSCAGVDLNRNFPKDYGGSGSTSRNSCSDVYIGGGAASEPETKALMSLMQESPMSVQIDVHAFSQLILASWSYTSAPHPRRAELLQLGNKMKSAVKSVAGADYEMGDNLLYEASGVLSDYSADLGALSYTYELRPASGGQSGFSPNKREILPGVKETLAGLYAAIDHAKR